MKKNANAVPKSRSISPSRNISPSRRASANSKPAAKPAARPTANTVQIQRTTASPAASKSTTTSANAEPPSDAGLGGRRNVSGMSLGIPAAPDTKEKLEEEYQDVAKSVGRRRRLSVAKGAENEIADSDQIPPGSPARTRDPPPQTVLEVGHTSRAGYEPDGFKKTNQDSYAIVPAIGGDTQRVWFGVFDGHGRDGHHVSHFVKEFLPQQFDKHLKTHSIQDSFEKAFQLTEDRLRGQGKFDCKMSGTTAVTCFVDKDRKVHVANAGDSRAVCATRDGQGPWKVLDLSIDQKPDRPDEKKRVEAAGGICEQMYDPEDGYVGPHRVWAVRQQYPGIAMSRSIGDLVAGTVGVICTPEQKTFTVEPNWQFMILASDGVWEFIESQEAVDLCAKYFPNVQEAADKLCDEALKRWREEEDVVDDITAIVVRFH